MDSYEGKIERIKRSLPKKGETVLYHGLPFGKPEIWDLQIVEDLFHLARKHNNYQEMKTAAQIASAYCSESLSQLWKLSPDGAIPDFSRILWSSMKNCALPEMVLASLSIIMGIWAEDWSRQEQELSLNCVESLMKVDLVSIINLCLYLQVIHADLDSGLIAPGPRFPGQLVEIASSFRKIIREQYG